MSRLSVFIRAHPCLICSSSKCSILGMGLFCRIAFSRRGLSADANVVVTCNCFGCGAALSRYGPLLLVHATSCEPQKVIYFDPEVSALERA
jgi:hypothetical protein